MKNKSMKKMALAVGIALMCVAAFCVEKTTTVPITGGFGITLGAKFTPQLAKQLKAERAKYDDDTVGYTVVPPKPFKGFTRYSVLLTKDRKIYKIQATCISSDTDGPFSDAVYLFQKKYGMVSGIRNELLFIDRKNPTRSVKITKSQFIAAIVYSDSAVSAADVDDI